MPFSSGVPAGNGDEPASHNCNLQDPVDDVTAPIKTLVEVWLGHVSIAQTAGSSRLGLDGTREDQKKFKDWFALSVFAKAWRIPPGPPAA